MDRDRYRNLVVLQQARQAHHGQVPEQLVFADDVLEVVDEGEIVFHHLQVVFDPPR